MNCTRIVSIAVALCSVLLIALSAGCKKREPGAQPTSQTPPKPEPPKQPAVAQSAIALPEYYGFYAIDNGKTLEEKTWAASGSLSPTVEFLLFHKAVPSGLFDLELYKLSMQPPPLPSKDDGSFKGWDDFYRKSQVDFPKQMEAAMSGIPTGSTLVEIRTKPVKDQAEMIRFVPSSTLAPGKYKLTVGAGGTEFWVDREAFKAQTVSKARETPVDAHYLEAFDAARMASLMYPEDAALQTEMARRQFCYGVNIVAKAAKDTGRLESREATLLEYTQALAAAPGRLEDHRDVASSLSALATARASLRWDDPLAQGLLESALQMNRRLYKGDSPELVASLSQLADSRMPASQQEDLLKEAQSMNQRLHKGDDAETARLMGRRAYTLEFALQRPTEAEPLFVQALEMERHLPGSDRKELADAVTSLAAFYQRTGRKPEAETLCEESVQIWRRISPDGSYYVAQAITELAKIRGDLGKAAEAESLFAEALEMYVRTVQPSRENFFVAEASSNLGIARRTAGRAKDAEPLFADAIQINRKLRNTRNVAADLGELALVLIDLDRQAEAIQKADEAVALLRPLASKHGEADLAKALWHAANARLSAKQIVEADGLIQECVAMIQRNPGAVVPPEYLSTRERILEAKAQEKARIEKLIVDVLRPGIVLTGTYNDTFNRQACELEVKAVENAGGKFTGEMRWRDLVDRNSKFELWGTLAASIDGTSVDMVFDHSTAARRSFREDACKEFVFVLDEAARTLTCTRAKIGECRDFKFVVVLPKE